MRRHGLFLLAHGHAVAIKRFDRNRGSRLHCISACVALRAAVEPFGYPELLQLLRRRGVAEGNVNTAHMRELFRRMVFNILIDNTDDHEKNHAPIVTDTQQYLLSPAFDVLPCGQALGFQQMRIGEQESDSTLSNALSQSQLFDLDKGEALGQVRAVARVVAQWRSHFRECGIINGDIELLADQIDRPFLKISVTRRHRRASLCQRCKPTTSSSSAAARPAHPLPRHSLRQAPMFWSSTRRPSPA